MASSTSTLPAWPPSLSKEAKEYLTQQATDYALAHGIVYRPLPSTSAADQAPAGDSVIHAPFSLFPSPFPRALLRKAHSIQPAYDHLYAQISARHDFLDKVIGQSVVHVDEFQKALWHIYTQVKDDLVQPLSLGLFRSDYLLHQVGQSELEIKQVEFNTISASFGALCTKVNALHQHLASTTAGFLGTYPGLENIENLPSNKGLSVLAGGLIAAHDAYSAQQQRDKASKVAVLFVVQPGERNAFDQRHIEYLLQERGITVVRQTFAEIQRNVSHLAGSTDQSKRSRTLVLKHAALGQLEISVVYFRAGYGPADYPTNAEWETRKMLEQSLAIKCPSIAVQLAGAKKVQQVLSEPGVLESFAQHADAQIEALRETFTDLYPLDDSPLGKEGYRLALDSPEKYVLKPQREGGGNNVYRQDIPPFLRELEKPSSAAIPQDQAALSNIARRQAYILMSLIQPPSGVGNYLVKASNRNPDATAAGQDPESHAVLASDTVSELGVYGAILFEADAKSSSADVAVTHHESGGYLLRTKGRESDEGGVAVGFSVIDSLFLV